MSTYLAPLEEIQFVLQELAGLDRVAKIPDAAPLLDRELTDAILDQAARFAQEVLLPADEPGDTIGAKWGAAGVTTAPGYKEAYRQLLAAEWNKISMPTEFGGQGLPGPICAAVREIFASANKAFCMCPDLGASAVEALLISASEELKSRFLPKLVSGEWAATMNLTESQAGSDVGAVRTRAVRQQDGTYRISGQKVFISFGDHDLTENILHLVLARTPDAPPGSRGISLFLVPKFLMEPGSPPVRNDVECVGIEHKVGLHGSPTCTMVYGDKGEGAVGWLVGEENAGLQYMFVMMNEARFNVAMESVAVSERAYQQALAYARERIQGKAHDGGGESVAIIQHPDVRRMLLSMRSQTEAMRSLGYWTSSAHALALHHPDQQVRKERKAFLELITPIFKGWASEAAIEVTRTSIQVHGGIGYITESGASQPLRDVLICPIYEGTTAIQANDLVTRKIVRDGGAAVRQWISEMRSLSDEIAGAGGVELAGFSREFGAGIDALVFAMEWILETYPMRPKEVLAGAVPFLLLAGTVAGAWQMGRAALAADKMLMAGEGNAAFLRNKIATARFYALHILPRADGLARTTMAGGAAVVESDAVFGL